MWCKCEKILIQVEGMASNQNYLKVASIKISRASSIQEVAQLFLEITLNQVDCAGLGVCITHLQYGPKWFNEGQLVLHLL